MQPAFADAAMLGIMLGCTCKSQVCDILMLHDDVSNDKHSSQEAPTSRV